MMEVSRDGSFPSLGTGALVEASRPLPGTRDVCVEGRVLRGGDRGRGGERAFSTSDFMILVLTYMELFFIP